MVPEGWDPTTLGEAVSFRSGGTPSKQKPEYWGGEIPWISAKDLKFHKIDKAIDNLTDDGARAAKMAAVNSILILVRGMTLLKDVPIGLVTKPVAFNQDIKALVAKDGVDPLFFSYYLAGKKSAMMGLVNTANHGTGRLDTDLLKGLAINLPPLPEQKKIAEILSTWDRAIETAKALLATARTQKRALMQTLLTGKRRFPEFEGQEWREVRVGDVTKVIVSNVDKKSVEAERPVRLCNYTDVYKRDFIDPSQSFMDATATEAQIKKFGLRVGDVVITKDSETADDIAMPTYVTGTADDLVCGYHLAIVRPGKCVDGHFLKFVFEMPHTRYYFGTRANGAIRFGLTIDGITGAKFNLPPLEEQRRITSVIVGAEQEISELIASIEKLRIEKKALMQQLLTGKRRVALK